MTQITSTMVAANMIKAAKDVAIASKWTAGYKAPKSAEKAFIMLLGQFRKNIVDHKVDPKLVQEAFNDVLILREKFENQIFKAYPKINQDRFKSMSCDSEIKKIKDFSMRYNLGVLDLLCGTIATYGI